MLIKLHELVTVTTIGKNDRVGLITYVGLKYIVVYTESKEYVFDKKTLKCATTGNFHIYLNPIKESKKYKGI